MQAVLKETREQKYSVLQVATGAGCVQYCSYSEHTHSSGVHYS